MHYIVAVSLDMKNKTLGKLSFRSSGTFRKLVLAGGLGLITLSQAAGVVLAGPTPVPTNGSWVQFRWALGNPGGATSAIEEPLTFTVPGGDSAVLDVTDYALPGDQFKITDTLSGDMWTTTVPDDSVFAYEDDPDDAFRDSRYSSGSFDLGPGDYELDIEVIRLTTLSGSAGGIDTPSGCDENDAGFIRVNLASAVPEPGAALWLLGAGLFGGLRRRR